LAYELHGKGFLVVTKLAARSTKRQLAEVEKQIDTLLIRIVATPPLLSSKLMKTRSLNLKSRRQF
jgi:hypothetical protein